jgi:lactate dehydrogenase-like 2-hydroxyacid dehydrogenase
MHVVSTDSRSSRQQLEQLLQQSDVVSMHCPLNDATQVRLLRKCAAWSSRTCCIPALAGRRISVGW